MQMKQVKVSRGIVTISAKNLMYGLLIPFFNFYLIKRS